MEERGSLHGPRKQSAPNSVNSNRTSAHTIRKPALSGRDTAALLTLTNQWTRFPSNLIAPFTKENTCRLEGRSLAPSPPHVVLET